MTELTFVDPKGEFLIISVSRNRIDKFTMMKDGIPTYSTLEGLKLSPVGIVKEFPDLNGKPISEIRKEGIKRFKEHLSKLNTEKETIDYIKNDLEKYGYKMMFIHKHGHRIQRVK